MNKANLHSSKDHHKFAAEKGPIHISIVTVSDSRTKESDTNAQYLMEAIRSSGHQVSEYHIIKDEADQVAEMLKLASESEAEIILFNGGTGISKRDTTFDVINQALEKTLPGFGEIFRMLSYEQIGAGAMLSRAVAGTYKGKIVISTPGSPAAVRLAWEKLIAPEIQHLAWELGR